MALGVVVDFVGTPLTGDPPLTVAFSDLSIVTDGFARAWFWDFGDGENSTDQNPVHEYNGVSGQSYNVKLRVLITSGEFDVITTSVSAAISAGGGSLEQNGFSLIGEAESWADYLLNSPIAGVSITARHALTRTGGTDRQYKNIKSDLSVMSSSPVTEEKIYTLTCTPSNFTELIGAASANGFSRGYSTSASAQFHSVIEGIVQSVPWNFSASVIPEGRLPDVTSTNQQRGLAVFWQITIYTEHSSQTSGSETKNNYVTIGTAPVADFDASPTMGPDGVAVQFENLTIPATGGVPTTYVWKKRLAGTADPFTQFSTDENPSEIFFK